MPRTQLWPCSNCPCTFASRLSAMNHLIRSYTIGLCPKNLSAHSHIAHVGSTAVQGLPRVEHGHPTTPTTWLHPVTTSADRNHVVVCASHAARRDRTGEQDGGSLTTTAGAGSSAATPKIGTGQGREGEATPPGHGQSGLGIHGTTRAAGCSTDASLQDTFLLAKLLPDRHHDEAGRTHVSSRVRRLAVAPS